MKYAKKLAFYLIAFLCFTPAISQHKYSYKIYNAEGELSGYYQMLEKAKQSDIVFFGELHNNPIAHWLQLELTKGLFEYKQDGLILGAEMFETDNQLILNEYLTDVITERNFNAEAKLWSNYSTDYKPLVEFAKENELEFIATNIPRRYASLVHREGFEALKNLDNQAKKLLPPLPAPYEAELPGYKAMLEMAGMPAHASENLPKAQAIKDATMAHFILKYYDENKLFLHFNGSYHSNNYEGIVWYLEQYGKNDEIMTISTVEQSDINTLDESIKGIADFIIVVSSNMTKTY